MSRYLGSYLFSVNLWKRKTGKVSCRMCEYTLYLTRDLFPITFFRKSLSFNTCFLHFIEFWAILILGHKFFLFDKVLTLSLSWRNSGPFVRGKSFTEIIGHNPTIARIVNYLKNKFNQCNIEIAIHAGSGEIRQSETSHIRKTFSGRNVQIRFAEYINLQK